MKRNRIKPNPYFEGWYFKCQSPTGAAIALIPAYHIDAANHKSASLQIITDSGTWYQTFPGSQLQLSPRPLQIQLGANCFSRTGLSLDIHERDLSLSGELHFGPLLPLRSDIMGPFRFLPHMECTHGVISMRHTLQGRLHLNGKFLDLDGGTGYIETDRGRSFPSAYLWTQCTWPSTSLMLSIATIPLSKLSFTGCICAIIHEGKEYRLATYRGAKVTHWSDHSATIHQGKYRLQADLLDPNAHPLRAPTDGTMTRTIHESLRSKTRYRLWIGDHLLFDHTDPNASFEHAHL